MEIVRHPGTNHVLAPPDGQEDTVSALPVVITRDYDDSQAMWSFWKPSAEELAMLVAGHSVALGVYSEQHPVVSVSVSRQILASTGPVVWQEGPQ